MDRIRVDRTARGRHFNRAASTNDCEFTREILLGYIPYLVVFVIVMDLLSRLGWGFVENLNAVKGAAYDAAVGYLAYAAWRKD